MRQGRGGHWAINLSALFVFIILSMLLTYPLVFQMKTAVTDYGDPLLTIWILAWDVQQILHNPGNLFDANIFYPHQNTLAYSEHLFGSSLIALPIIVFFKDVILAYNFVLLFSFVLSGFGMYLLVRHLTRNFFAGLIAGVIFAYCPFRFAHLGHLHLLASQWMPFTFLYLHKFFDDSNYKNLSLFTFFFVLQALSCGHYGLFIGVSLALAIIYFLAKKRYLNRNILLKLGVFAVVSVLLLYPFFRPYARIKEEMGFSREIDEIKFYSADVQSYLVARGGNRLYGRLTKRFWKPEGKLFPGLLAIVLSAVAILKLRPRQDLTKKFRLSLKRRKIVMILNGLIVFGVFVTGIVLIKGGFDFRILGWRIRTHNWKDPVLIILGLAVVRWLICEGKGRHLSLGGHKGLYAMLGLAGFIFSLGPELTFFGNRTGVTLPYIILYKWVPGFGGLRAPARFAIMVMLSLSVLAGFGAVRFSEAIGRTKRYLKNPLLFLIGLLLIGESLYIPIHYRQVPKAIPNVYKWLADQRGDFAILELPMPTGFHTVHRETWYMYWSTFHWKKLVNGYSGFFPPSYWPINEQMQKFPSQASIDILNKLGLKYVVVHSDRLPEGKWLKIVDEIPSFQDSLKLKIRLGSDYVYELKTSE